ncbi:MAG: OsmC family protein [Alphaproteobacteria bacterium]|nr:OsmC family protein [Alphaproteobacteria bacterium]MBM3950805.1 OsmC family protein [Rhodospirillales bacterium]
MSEGAEISVTITQQRDYRFLIDFGETIPQLLADEPAPIGSGQGPSPDQLLLAAVANCMSASLFFALKKFKQDAGGIRTTASARVGRNAENRLRIQEIALTIRLGKPGDTIERLDRILAQFEDFCTVSQSVRRGIPLAVAVEDGRGARLK